MNTLFRKRLLAGLSALALVCASAQRVAAQAGSVTPGIHSSVHFADYDAEPRLPNGHVDCDTLVSRLKQLHVTTYYWLILHAATDWEDLKVFLPKAAQANLQVWVYLVPPTESAPKEGSIYMEPFRLDYGRWAEAIARLSLQHTNLTGWVIDDFYANHAFFTPAYVRGLQHRAKSINPKLVFYPLMYFPEIRRPFVEAYHDVVDGVVVAYPQGTDDIYQAWAMLNDAVTAVPGELSFPADTASRAGDFIQASQTAFIYPNRPVRVRFRERDDYTGPTAGYHCKQLLVNGKVVWDEDVAGGSNAWREVSVDLTPEARDQTDLTLAFRLWDKKGVANFPVHWQVKDLQGEGLDLAAGLDLPKLWEVSRRGDFQAGFGRGLKPARHRFHIPFIVMTAGQATEFRHRHGDPASPERMAAWLRFCLEAWRAGKCDGVATYCLDKRPGSRIFDLASELFGHYSALP
jgi:hypothetical protein